MSTETESEATVLKTSIGRRAFLKASAAAGGGLLINFSWLSGAAAASGEAATDQAFELNAYLRIAPSGDITAMVPNPEFGQNLMTSMRRSWTPTGKRSRPNRPSLNPRTISASLPGAVSLSDSLGRVYAWPAPAPDTCCVRRRLRSGMFRLKRYQLKKVFCRTPPPEKPALTERWRPRQP